MFDVINSDLSRLEDTLLEAVTAPDELVTEVGTHLVTSGGKRLRPALCLLSAHGGPAFDLEHTLPLATALELIHTASLVHDDVIDKADTRRGAPTANAKWDNKIAILAGDFIFARAFHLVTAGGYGDHVSGRLAWLVGNLSVGEIIQDKEMYRASRDEADYYNRIQKKTADFLEICCELGALVGGMKKEDCQDPAGFMAFMRPRIGILGGGCLLIAGVYALKLYVGISKYVSIGQYVFAAALLAWGFWLYHRAAKQFW